jgi:hypothetical protein
MIRRPNPPIALAALAFAAVASCSPSSGTAKHDASSALAAKGRLDTDRAAVQVRRKADLEEAGARARSRAARDIAHSDARAAQSAANN